MDKIISLLTRLLTFLKSRKNKNELNIAPQKEGLVPGAPFEHEGMIIHASPAPLQGSLDFDLTFRFGVVANDPTNVIYHIESMYITGKDDRAQMYLAKAPKQVIAQMISIFCKLYHVSPYGFDEIDEITEDELGELVEPKKEYLN